MADAVIKAPLPVVLYPNIRKFLPPPRLSGLSTSGYPGVLMGAHSALPATHGWRRAVAARGGR